MKRGDIYLAKFTKNGNVQAGLRPVIIIQNNIGNHFSPTTIVCIITSAKKKYMKTHVNIGTSGGLHKNSTILCEQIQTVNKSDLIQYIGCLSDPYTLNRVDKSILISLGVYNYDKSNGRIRRPIRNDVFRSKRS